MKKIIMKTLSAGPEGSMVPGQTYAVDESTAEALVNGRFAEYASAPKMEKAVKAPEQEKAIKPPPEGKEPEPNKGKTAKEPQKQAGATQATATLPPEQEKAIKPHPEDKEPKAREIALSGHWPSEQEKVDNPSGEAGTETTK